MIHKYIRKCKYLTSTLGRREDLFIALLIVLVGFGSFGLGRLSSGEGRQEPLSIEIPQNQATIVQSIPHGTTSLATINNADNVVKNYVASLTGTKYHLPTCPGAKQISKAKQIWFATKADAEKAGYEPAANCKGL